MNCNFCGCYAYQYSYTLSDEVVCFKCILENDVQTKTPKNLKEVEDSEKLLKGAD
jgi:hypothetical protein